jgi:hypothetical protein
LENWALLLALKKSVLAYYGVGEIFFRTTLVLVHSNPVNLNNEVQQGFLQKQELLKEASLVYGEIVALLSNPM